MRNNNKSPKSGNDRAFGKEKFGEKGNSSSRNFANEGRDFRKDSGDRPARSHGKPEYNKSKGFGERSTGERSFSKDSGDRPARSYGKPEYNKSKGFGERNTGERSFSKDGSDRSERSYGKPDYNKSKGFGERNTGERSFSKDSSDRPARSHGKPEYNKSKGFGERNTGERSFSKDTDRKPTYGKYAEKRTPFGNNSEREEKRPFTGEDRRVFGKGERRESGRPSYNADKKFSSDRSSYRKEEEEGSFKLAYEPKFKKKDFADKNKRDYFERKSRANDKIDQEEKGQSRTKRGAKSDKPVVNKRQHNPSGKVGSPRYNFDKEGPKAAKGVKSINKSSEEEKKVRLNRYIANAGICSRREADDLITSGQITVNGKVLTELGYQVKKSDTVKLGKKTLNPEKLIYVLMNKPKDYITTMDDPEDRKTVMDLLEGAFPERVYPVGRLDRNTTGLLLLTNDGELADKLTHPSFNTRKIYQAELDKPFTDESFEKLKAGVQLEDGFIKPDDLAIVTPDAYVVGIEIHSGKNRVVRRIFEHLGYDVKKLDRTVFANLNKRDLPRGKWRYLSEKEVVGLKFMS